MMADETTTEDVTTTAVIDEEEDEEEQEGVAAAEDSIGAQSENNSTPWHMFGTMCPKEVIVFVCQVIVLHTFILISIYNLTNAHGNSNLLPSLGYLLPNPPLRRHGD